MNEEPLAGHRYEMDTGVVFMVAEIDAAKGWIDVQYLNGRVDRFDPEVWQGLNLIEIEPADEWRGTMDKYFRERGPKQH